MRALWVWGWLNLGRLERPGETRPGRAGSAGSSLPGFKGELERAAPGLQDCLTSGTLQTWKHKVHLDGSGGGVRGAILTEMQRKKLVCRASRSGCSGKALLALEPPTTGYQAALPGGGDTDNHCWI